MDPLLILFGTSALAFYAWAWRALPARISAAHEAFRTSGGEAKAGEFEFRPVDAAWSGKATFFLVVVPRVVSLARIRDGSGEGVHVKVTTVWPSLRSIVLWSRWDGWTLTIVQRAQ